MAQTIDAAHEDPVMEEIELRGGIGSVADQMRDLLQVVGKLTALLLACRSVGRSQNRSRMRGRT